MTRGGALDIDALGSIDRSHLDELVGRVRAVAPSVSLSCFVLCSAGSDERTRTIARQLAGSFVGGFFGAPETVAASVVALESSGVARVNLSAFSDSTFDELAPLLPLER